MSRIEENKNFLKYNLDSILAIIKRFMFKVGIFSSNKVGDLISHMQDVKTKSKDLVATNIKVLEEHLKNNNFFDAKIRAKIILKLEPLNLEAMLALGYIYLNQNKLEKAKIYFEKSLKLTNNEEEIKNLQSILNEIQKFKNENLVN